MFQGRLPKRMFGNQCRHTEVVPQAFGKKAATQAAMRGVDARSQRLAQFVLPSWY